jgi:membrane protease YdiL (CAAX protease family)
MSIFTQWRNPVAIALALAMALVVPPRADAQEGNQTASSAHTPPRPASVVLLPVVSVFIPGFGQLAHRDYLSGLAYSSAGISGLVLATTASYDGKGSLDDFMFDAPGARRVFYGFGLYQGAGFLSAWDAFHSSVPVQQDTRGRFKFLPKQKKESVADLLLAPFRLEHLKRPSTWIPLGALAGVSALGVSAYRSDKDDTPGLRWHPYEPSDAFFTGALSMNAGVTEEALFRGYLFPLFHQWSGERAWVSNPAQSLLFASAHIGGVTNVPIAQALFGYYMGWVTQRNDWSLGQAVAIHFWWDVMAVSAALFTRHDVPISLGSFSIPVDL